MILRVGLTGGIGSGKTTVAQVFEVLGIPVYYADLEAKRIINDDKDVVRAVTALFGEQAYANGHLERKYIASLVFENRRLLEELNAIVHPATIKDAEAWMHAQKTPYAIKEAALIFETSARQHLDYIIGVSAPEDLRIRRVVARDALNHEEVLKRMGNQMNEEEKLSLCDFLIYNDETQLVVPQVTGLHEMLLMLAK